MQNTSAPKLYQHTACYYQGKLYLFGGRLQGDVNENLFVYTFLTNSWQKKKFETPLDAYRPFGTIFKNIWILSHVDKIFKLDLDELTISSPILVNTNYRTSIAAHTFGEDVYVMYQPDMILKFTPELDTNVRDNDLSTKMHKVHKFNENLDSWISYAGIGKYLFVTSSAHICMIDLDEMKLTAKFKTEVDTGIRRMVTVDRSVYFYGNNTVFHFTLDDAVRGMNDNQLSVDYDNKFNGLVDYPYTDSKSHAGVYCPDNRCLYFHGGWCSVTNQSNVYLDNLLEYDVTSCLWRMIDSTNAPKMRKARLMDQLLIIKQMKGFIDIKMTW